ncbi:MAG: Fur family transcriptional regulator [Anaerolineaceae bacterium]|nr:Fur family transcriptional regulator [Anaerolineaceae bacterium]
MRDPFARLRAEGYRITPARRAVLATILAEDGDHLSSAAILQRVQERAPTVGRASVFRALELFTRLAFIRPSYLHQNQTPVYVRLDGGHHHHVVCIQCRRVFEFEECDLEGLTEQLERQFRAEIRGHLLEFYALCEHCHA